MGVVLRPFEFVLRSGSEIGRLAECLDDEAFRDCLCLFIYYVACM